MRDSKRTWMAAAVAMMLCASVAEAAEKPKKPAPGSQPTTTDKIVLHDKSTVEFTLVKIPAGKVTIKDKDGKDVEVEVKPIWMGQTEVTWPEYDVFYMALDLPEAQRPLVKNEKNGTVIRQRPSVPYESPERNWGNKGMPAGSLFDREAVRYCDWLSKMTGHKYRLPTEAEWEYAARAGGAPLKPEGKDLDEVAWYWDNSDQQPHEVAKKKPNAWGLYDMLGNVAEWVALLDKSAPHPTALAGGSFADGPEAVHSAAREPYDLKKLQKADPQIPKGWSWMASGPHVGFRVVRED
jgi:formylglycine-generating enzyme required for sulfatase activity